MPGPLHKRKISEQREKERREKGSRYAMLTTEELKHFITSKGYLFLSSLLFPFFFRFLLSSSPLDEMILAMVIMMRMKKEKHRERNHATLTKHEFAYLF